MVLLVIAIYLAENQAVAWSARVIIIMATVFRILFLFRSPELSDDIYRYLWDGLTILHGDNPYALAPSDSKFLTAESVALLSQVNHPQLITIYPPVAQFIFAMGALSGGVLGIKTLLVAADIASCAVILRILARINLPQSFAVLYAWSPLPVMEIASSGHIDGAGVSFLLLAFMFLLPRNDGEGLSSSTNGFAPVSAGVAFALATLVKLFPIAFFPALFLLTGKKGRWPFILGAVIASLALSLPFLPALYNMFVTLDIYALNWEFAGFAYQSLYKLFSSGATARLILAVLFLTITAILYALLYRKTGNPTDGCFTPSTFLMSVNTAYCVALAFLLLTPTLYPWYALYLACLLPFAPGAGGLVLTWAVFLSYRVLIPFTILGTWEEKDAIPAMIWVAAMGALILSWLAGKLSRAAIRSLIVKDTRLVKHQ